MCETRLQALTCPACGEPIKEAWKRCPQCEALLLCPHCQHRLTKGQTVCPHCGPEAPRVQPVQPQALFTDTICGLEMLRIPGGTFQMGDTFGQGMPTEQPVHGVTLDDYYLARFVVTQEQWMRLMPDNPSKNQGLNLPVEQVDWEQAVTFARLLTERHQGRYLFDLPSEAQWEFAARSGGKQERYAGGDRIDTLAWYEANSQGRTQPVGTRAPNGLGLYDMSGNVWEWCRDHYVEDAYNRPVDRNPVVTAKTSDRVIRGGSWHLDAWSARCARRFSCTQDFFGPGLGFRLVMTLSPSGGAVR
jgi:formylglycine-generating enzyme required for sulfatase activity